MKIRFAIILIFSCAVLAISASAQTLTDDQLSHISFDQNLGAQISLGLPFRDEDGKGVTFGDYFGQKPVVLVLGYYECPMLCTLTFNGMVEAMNDMKWSIGDQFNVVYVSINPKETSQLAAAKKQTYLRRYGRPGADAGWHFLTGDEPAIRKLADEVGFHYAYDPAVKQYAHPSGLVILTPEGKTAKYFFGVTFSSPAVYTALKDASVRKVGSPIERLVLLCFHYSPIHGKYGAAIMEVIRILGVVTLAGMIWLCVAMVRGERKRRASFHPELAAGSLAKSPRDA
ncbi:MAG TPA: SCO family protein [Verrucomicrobiae bacterium]|jgi:protein SCO1/2|nr:SCO family protein [Verrucomicrobiae bacterium]